MIWKWFQKQAPVWDKKLEMVVNVEIESPNEGRYRRPYVAVWVEDKEGFPVRTLSLWVMSRPPGPRWFPNLRRWYRTDRMRQATDRTDLVATISGPTRQPGKYTVVWDGLDDGKQPVPQGEYTIYVEAAREHGTYQILKKTLTLGARPMKADLGSNPEIKSASLELRKRA